MERPTCWEEVEIQRHEECSGGVDEDMQPLFSQHYHNIQPHHQPSKRLASLDVFRGLTIAVMILVDDAGGSWPSINHSPWNGITLADFVMPFFLFIVGMSIVLALKKVSDRKVAIQKVVTRFLKLFALGILLQGGYFHQGHDLGYGVDISHIRILGILQRIAIAYLIVAICEICTSKTAFGQCSSELRKTYYWQGLVACILVSIHCGLLFGLYVPTWQFHVTTDSFNASQPYDALLTVKCNVRGDLGPACNAVGFIDRTLMGLEHLYQRPVYRRTKECSVNSPDYGALPRDAPNWCVAPFDPEGILSSVMAVVTCFAGSHCGHVLVRYKDDKRRLFSWIILAVGLFILGFLAVLSGMPLNKPLYTFSYACITAGAAAIVFSAFYILVDVYGWCSPFLLLEWMGMNALLIYALAACDLFSAAVKGIYWTSADHNLVDFTEHVFHLIMHSSKWAKLFYVLFEILFWCLIAGLLKKKGIFWKL